MQLTSYQSLFTFVSPKDAYTSTVNQKMTDIYLQELKKSDGTPNGDLCAFSNAGRLVSVVHSGKEALEVSHQLQYKFKTDKIRSFKGVLVLEKI